MDAGWFGSTGGTARHPVDNTLGFTCDYNSWNISYNNNDVSMEFVLYFTLVLEYLWFPPCTPNTNQSCGIQHYNLSNNNNTNANTLEM
ncbi:hypothetical protein Pcinc_028309 [Petrolisthes cinctipes]|uniref:Uncharacterized protein n=1 Tax=Petrolisthes cinctipes TaxID=88211 RepID=A0AAE1F3F0_PETCI|nr:hypothetical protein Pcinc_028309 [Petrolisthes cinctipes]